MARDIKIFLKTGCFPSRKTYIIGGIDIPEDADFFKRITIILNHEDLHMALHKIDPKISDALD